MPNARTYPATVAECIDDSMRFNPAAFRAVRRLARSKPWQGDAEMRRAKLYACGRELAAAYGIHVPHVTCNPGLPDCYVPAECRINLSPRLSVVTFLHEFAHHLQHCRRGRTTERFACRWSINLFKRCFPRSFARCVPEGHCLRRPI